jgi:hypothetical protein
MSGYVQGPGPYKGSEARKDELTAARHGVATVRISAGSSHNCDGKFLDFYSTASQFESRPKFGPLPRHFDFFSTPSRRLPGATL